MHSESCQTLRQKSPNTEFFLVRIQENTDQKKLRIWTLFRQWNLIGAFRSVRSLFSSSYPQIATCIPEWNIQNSWKAHQGNIFVLTFNTNLQKTHVYSKLVEAKYLQIFINVSHSTQTKFVKLKVQFTQSTPMLTNV